jgi:hypothetical protein
MMRQQPLREALTRARRRKQVTYLFQEKNPAEKPNVPKSTVPLRTTDPADTEKASLPSGPASDVVE